MVIDFEYIARRGSFHFVSCPQFIRPVIGRLNCDHGCRHVAFGGIQFWLATPVTTSTFAIASHFQTPFTINNENAENPELVKNSIEKKAGNIPAIVVCASDSDLSRERNSKLRGEQKRTLFQNIARQSDT